MLSIELHTKDIPEIYDRFSKEIGEGCWKERVASIRQEIKGNPLLHEYHQQESSIAFQLEQLRDLKGRFGGVAVQQYNDHSHYSASSFAAQVLSVIKAVNGLGAERFRSRVRACIKNNPSDLRALRLELATATHFLRQGKKVSWPEMAQSYVEGQRIYDLLVEDIGPNGLELECKSFSEDKGRKITRREALDFFWLIRSQNWKKLKLSPDGVAVVVTVEKRLPVAYKDRVALSDLVSSLALSGRTGIAEFNGVTVNVIRFEPSPFNALIEKSTQSEHRRLLDQLTGTENKEIVAMSTSLNGALVFVLQSKEDDTLMSSIERTLKDSASNQFSRSRAGVMVAGLEGLNPDQLISLAMQDKDGEDLPTALRVYASRILDSPGRDHLVGTVFLSSSDLRHVTNDAVSSSSTSYHFLKRESPFWSDEFSGLFQQSED